MNWFPLSRNNRPVSLRCFPILRLSAKFFFFFWLSVSMYKVINCGPTLSGCPTDSIAADETRTANKHPPEVRLRLLANCVAWSVQFFNERLRVAAHAPRFDDSIFASLSLADEACRCDPEKHQCRPQRAENIFSPNEKIRPRRRIWSNEPQRKVAVRAGRRYNDAHWNAIAYFIWALSRGYYGH